MYGLCHMFHHLWVWNNVPAGILATFELDLIQMSVLDKECNVKLQALQFLALKMHGPNQPPDKMHTIADTTHEDFRQKQLLHSGYVV